jgi:hypothetical protein
VYRVGSFLVVTSLLSLCASTAMAATPHATARKLLLTCETAVNAVPIVVLKAHTPQVSKANRRAQVALNKCTGGPWRSIMSKRPKDKPLHDAYHAWLDLSTGIGQYLMYSEHVASGHAGKGLLHEAQHEIAKGRKEARHALAEL